MKKLVVLSLLFISAVSLSAQEPAKEQKINYKFYGFVRNDLYYNSRLNVEGTDGLSTLYPLGIKQDVNLKDINEVPQSEMLAYGTRFGWDFSGIDLFGSVTTAKFESDISGNTGNNNMIPLFRVRHAFVNFNWGKTEMFVGQNWHPMFSGVIPTVLNLGTGAPFHPFARNPQVNLSYKIKDLKFTAAAIYQFQYSSTGPAGGSSNYIKYANMPEVYTGIEYKNKTWIVGIGGELKKIVPRVATSVIVAGPPSITTDYKVDESLLTYGATAYAQYTKNLFCIKAKATYGQNLSDLTMLGGYAVSTLDAISKEQTYSSFNMISGWMNATYGKKYQLGIFGGYTQNLGTDDALYVSAGDLTMYGLGISKNQMIGLMYKISPQISYNLSNFKMGIEYDYTIAEWGNVSASDGIVRNAKEVLNHRLLAFMAYYF